MIERNKQGLQLFIGILMVLGAAWMLGYAIKPGIGLASDSYYYLSGADTLAQGDGFGRIAGNGEFKPITHFPPLYSFALLITQCIGDHQLEAVSVLQQVLLIGSIVLGSVLVYRLSHSKTLAFLAILLMGAAPAMLNVFSWMLSEGLFILIAMLVFVLVSRLQNTSETKLLILAGLMTGLAYLTRYIGITLAGAVGLALLIGGNTKRWTALGVYLGSSAVLPVIWLLRNWFVAGVTTNRSLGWHPITVEKFRTGIAVLANWLLPGQFPDALRAGSLIVLAGIILLGYILLWRRERKLGLSEISMLAFILIYPAFLVFSISVLDAATPLDERILSPLYPVAVILGLSLYARSQSAFEWPRWGKAIVITGLALSTGLTLVRGVRQVGELHLDGQGFNSAAWRHSELIQWLSLHPEGTLFYSNELDAIYLLTGQLVYQIPIQNDPVRDQPREDFPEQLESMRSRLQTESGYLILFETLSNQLDFYPSEEELSQGLDPVLETPLGTVYRSPLE